MLWIEAYPTSPTPDSNEVLFILYGPGAEPRFFKPNGEYIPHTGIGSGPVAFNLVRMVKRQEPHYDAYCRGRPAHRLSHSCPEAAARL